MTFPSTPEHHADAAGAVAVLLAEAQVAALCAALRPLVAELVAELTAATDREGDERWLTPEQAASRVGVHRRTIYRALTAGVLPGGRVRTANGGTRWRIRVADVDAWVQAKDEPRPVPARPLQRSRTTPKHTGGAGSYRARVRPTVTTNRHGRTTT